MIYIEENELASFKREGSVDRRNVPTPTVRAWCRIRGTESYPGGGPQPAWSPQRTAAPGGNPKKKGVTKGIIVCDTVRPLFNMINHKYLSRKCKWSEKMSSRVIPATGS